MQNDTDDSKPANDREKELSGRRRKKMARYFLLGALAITAVFFLNMVKIFILPVFLAVVVTGLFYPLYRLILKITNNRRSISAFLCCFVIILGVLIPVYVLGELVARDG